MESETQKTLLSKKVSESMEEPFRIILLNGEVVSAKNIQLLTTFVIRGKVYFI